MTRIINHMCQQNLQNVINRRYQTPHFHINLSITGIFLIDNFFRRKATLKKNSHGSKVSMIWPSNSLCSIPSASFTAIILIGEPVRWESCLQLLIDLMITNGKPDHNPEDYPSQHLPVLACNMDLVFMAEACMPR